MDGSRECYSELHVRSKHCVFVYNVPELYHVIMDLYRLRSDVLHGIYISADNIGHPAAFCISQRNDIVVEHRVRHALAYNVDTIPVQWKGRYFPFM